MGNDINSVISSILALKRQGGNPQSAMQFIINQNPNYQQTITQMKNMANGRNPQEFIMQLAVQNGVSQENILALQELFRGN